MKGKLVTDVVSQKGVEKFSEFWFKNMGHIKTVNNEALLRFCEDHTFTKEEYDAFKRGVATMMDFMLACYEETNRNKMKKK